MIGTREKAKFLSRIFEVYEWVRELTAHQQPSPKTWRSRRFGEKSKHDIRRKIIKIKLNYGFTTKAIYC
jgi:hypothetical protein